MQFSDKEHVKTYSSSVWFMSCNQSLPIIQHYIQLQTLTMYISDSSLDQSDQGPHSTSLGHIMHQSFVTTAPPPTGNSGDNDFSSIRALLKALHCVALLRVIALLFIRVNFTGVYMRNITSPAFTRYCGGTQKVIARTLVPLSPAHPRKWGGQGLQMTGALLYGKTNVFS